MTVPSYTTDLQTVSLCDAIGTWIEIPSRKSGSAPILEDRAYIEGSKCISQATGVATGKTAGAQFDYGGNIASWVSGWVIMMWQFFQAPKVIDTWANGGMRIGIGSGSGDVDLWNAQGNDYGRNPYGGWGNVAIDPEYAGGYDERVGTPTAGNYRYFWSAPNMLLAVSKGNPHCIDAVRYGRGELKIEYGETASYGTFAGIATQNDASRWGLLQAEGTGYLWKGLMSFGNSTNACDFRDSNRNITVDDTPRTYAAFNKIEINNASSRVDWTGVNITTLDESGLSVGSFEMINDATVNFTSCVFTGMNTFIFDSNAVLDAVTFRRCGQVTQAGAAFDNCIFDESPATIALVADDLTAISDCDFVSDGNGYAIEGFSAAGSYTLDGLTFTDYASSDGSTGDEALHVLASSGTVTINYTGAAPSVHSAGATIVMVGSSVDITVTVKTAAGVNVENAKVLLKAKDGTGPFPFEETVTSITNSGTTATVAHTGHGMASNDYVQIAGASLLANNGVFQITVNSVDEYEYTMGSTPGSSPTGTIKCTFVALYGLSSALGVVTTSREYGSDQPVIGWARKSTSTPFYKSAPLIGTVDDVDGFTAIGVMIADE